MRALVTGATGFVGANLVARLVAEGHDVRAMVRQDSDMRGLAGLDVERVEADLRDAAAVDRAVRGCDVVFHTAAKVAFWVPPARRGEFYEVNAIGSRHVFAASLRADVERVVHTSTISTIGLRADGQPTTEDDIYALWRDGTDYEHSKLAAEFEAWRFGAAGLRVVAVLPTAPIGGRDRTPNPVGRLVLDFLARKLPGFDGGLNLIDVEDVARGHLLAARHGVVGERYILGHANLEVADVFAALHRVSGVRAPRWRVPYHLALGVAHALTFVADRITRRHPLFTPAMVKLGARDYYVDCGKAKRELGFEPRSNPVRGAAIAIRWFLEHGYLRLGKRQLTDIRDHVEAALAAPA